MSRLSIEQALKWASQQHQAGRRAEAEKVYRQILAQQPNHAEATHLLGVIALQEGHVADALKLLRRSVEIEPKSAMFFSNLGLGLQRAGELPEAESAFRRAIELDPNLAAAHSSLGNVLATLKRADEAMPHLRRAIELRPADMIFWNNLATVEKAQDHFAAAERSLQRALEINPNEAAPYANLGNVLLWSGRVDEALAAYRKSVELSSGNHMMQSNLLMALHYHPSFSPAQILAEHQRWAESVAHLSRKTPALPNDRSPDRRLRVAYVSCDFREHPIAYFMEPILRHHDRSRFEVFCYADLPLADAYTQRLNALVEHWKPIKGGTSDEELTAILRNDRIDILIDLAAHTAHNRLLTFARRAAPVQMAYLGYCGTTGLPTMDYRVTDNVIDPPGSEANGTETLMRLDRVMCAYAPPIEIEVAPSPAAASGYVTFGALCTLAKVNGAVIALWAKLLNDVPNAKLLIQSRGLDGEMAERLRNAFAAHGVDAQRLDLHNHSSLDVYFRRFGGVDIALDPFPYSAHTTTCHALWMGVPVVTLAGETSVSRVSASVLTSIGLPELIATSPPQYIEIATKLAGDVPRLAELRATMRHRVHNSPLMDGADMTRQLEAAYSKAWIDYVRA